MEEITPKRAIEISKNLNKFSYFSNPFYLCSSCLVEDKNGEEMVLEKDLTEGRNASLFLPKNKENMKNQIIGTGFDEDIESLKKLKIEIKSMNLIGTEYIYKTEEFIKMEGGKFKSFRKSVNNFNENYQFKVLTDYPKDKIIDFMNEWKSKKDLSDKSELTKQLFESDLKSCMHYLDLLEEIPHKKIFVEVEDKLAGFSIFLPLHKNLWVGLMQKVNYEYKGLARFIYHLKAKEMKDIEFFTTGAEAQDPKLAEFKESLNPINKLNIYMICTK